MGGKQNEYGEGNYKATREYNEATKKFIESGRWTKLRATPRPIAAGGAEMKEAEQAALFRAKAPTGDQERGRRPAVEESAARNPPSRTAMSRPTARPLKGSRHASLRRHLFHRRDRCRVFGFGGIAAGATEIAKILFFIFLCFSVSLIAGSSRA